MSPREEVQERCYRALADSDEWTAPYGVIVSMRPFGRGKVRTINFGVARYLDAELLIISPRHLALRAEGALAYACPKRFDSCDSFLRWAADPWRVGVPR